VYKGCFCYYPVHIEDYRIKKKITHEESPYCFVFTMQSA
jgi:hypothetical protein